MQISRKLLKKVSSVYQVEGENRFKIIAYDKAAEFISKSSDRIFDLWNSGKLGNFPGIGKNIASHLDELFKSGKVEYFNRIFPVYPNFFSFT